MKLIKSFSKNFFKYKKSRSISRSDDPNDPSFTSGASSSSDKGGGLSTPTSVLPTLSNEWSSEISTAGVYSDYGDGKIRKEQLEAILSRVGGKSPPSEEELVMLLDELDKKGDGCISLEDFEAITSSAAAAEAESFEVTEAAEMKDAFDFFDEDHDGKITAEELFNVFRMIGDERCTLEECKRMIASVDKNGDGFVCFEDFCLMMEQQSSMH